MFNSSQIRQNRHVTTRLVWLSCYNIVAITDGPTQMHFDDGLIESIDFIIVRNITPLLSAADFQTIGSPRHSYCALAKWPR